LSKFKYKYEGIKNVKEAFEKKAQKELSVIDLTIKRKQEEIEQLLTEKKKRKSKITSVKKVKVSDLKFSDNFIKVIDAQIKEKESEIVELKNKRLVKLRELEQKSKEAKVFNKLKEKHFHDYKVTENRNEMKEIDDVATRKHSTKS
jgi:flagellar FliJ protein